jgi:signal transduction histidine kinase
MQTALRNAKNDTMRLDINRKLGFFHQDSDPAKALPYHESQLALAKKLQLKIWEADAYQQIAYCNTALYKLSAGYENYMQGLKIAEDPATATTGWGYSNFSNSKSPEEARQSIVGMIHFELFNFYNITRQADLAFEHTLKALKIGERLNNLKILSLANRDIGNYYLNINKPDSAFGYLHKALMYYSISPYKKNIGGTYGLIGQCYEKKQQYDSAKFYYTKGMNVSLNDSSLVIQGTLYSFFGNVFIKEGKLDSALMYTLQAERLAISINDLGGKVACLYQLATIKKLKGEYAIAYDYLERGKTLNDTLSNVFIDKIMQFQNVDFDQKLRLQALEKESELAKSRTTMYAMLAGLGIFLIVGLLLYRNNRQKQIANKVLESTLTNLKSTQTQLVQSEKMASLGELTAGIAHEIQNPLNFVNNFSEVNKELLAEMKDEIDKGNLEEVKLIANDVTDNEEKTNHHGKRADAIVKGMLQHSRASTDKKEPTDINALCDEYLRLSYHGLRAKDKSFNAIMQTDFDRNIGMINIIPQDIGRVILNLLTNAFYAVNEKKNLNIDGYEPTLLVSTKKVGDKVEIKVADNGNGIPQKVLDKIFQPFFTTKPTGQGTGLGLSLSYDIIKAHGGELKVETTEGEGSEFIIQLPAWLREDKVLIKK